MTSTVRIDSLAAGGDGVGRDEEGRVTFVSYAAPGDLLQVRVTDAHARFARAELVEVLEAGPGRVEPPCPLFRDRTCGGCSWQHVAHEVQAAAKAEIVGSALRRFSAAGLATTEIATPAPAYHWRRRARMHWFRGKRVDAAVVGFFPPKSHRVTLVERCPQIVPALEAALEPVHRVLAPGLHKRGELELLAGAGGEVHASIRGPAGAAAARRLSEEPLIAGVRAGRRWFGAESVELEPGLDSSAERFAQASAEGNRALCAAVERAAGPLAGKRVLELFAGSGNLTRVLAAAGPARLVASDRAPRPASAGELGLEWRRGPSEQVVAELARGGERFDVVVLDPPRAGARSAAAGIPALGPARVVYVSCDPATLARDLAVLVDRGYRPERAEPLDLMPQTPHVEVVVTLSRVDDQSPK